ncbi:MAG: hypothetical protein A2Z25_01760 [Planctomycetes bacterium RBG_16_55_9]|nr:MAG: hypothetical protein A2Z25_01760 [Planctomycetes bacterium RBG_16_55_9]
MLTLTGSAFADVIAPERIYEGGTGSNEPSYLINSNESQSVNIPPDAWPVQYPGLRKQAFDIGPEIYHFEYKEPGFMKEEGVFYGVRFGYTDRSWVPTSSQASPADGGMMLRAEGRLAYGQVDYDGQTIGGTPYTIDGIDDLTLEGRFLLGGDWLSSDVLNTLYAGIGYRYLLDMASTDPAGYDRESNYLYVPAGFQFNSSCEDGWSFGFNAEFDVFIVGVQRSHLSDIGLIDVDNRQDSGYGYRASFRLQHNSKDTIFIIEPFYRYWDIDRSEIENVIFLGPVVEPANETEEVGISILWMF